MIQAILAADVPVVAYVAPSGARAASAGTYLMYASHVAAMAPATNLGAATPVQIGGGLARRRCGRTTARDRKDGNGARRGRRGRAGSPAAPWSARPSTTPSPTSAASPNCAAATSSGPSVPCAKAPACRRTRRWRRTSSTSSRTDLPELLRAIDGRVVKLQSREVTLQTAGIVLREVEPDWRTRAAAADHQPERRLPADADRHLRPAARGLQPGRASLPGVVGAISLLLALFAFQVLSVNYAGLALIALGVLLIVAESFVPSFGALGLGGIVAFVIGSVMLLDNDVPGFGIAWQLIGAMGAGRRAGAARHRLVRGACPAPARRERPSKACCASAPRPSRHFEQPGPRARARRALERRQRARRCGPASACASCASTG